MDTTTTILQFGQKNLFIPTVTNYVRDVYVKATLVMWNGNRPPTKSKVLNSNVVRGTLNPVWNDEDSDIVSEDTVFHFTAENGMEWADFVRLEIIDARNAASALQEEKIGAIFIPLADFHFGAKNKTYRITSTKPLPKYLLDAGGLGTVTVRIEKENNLMTQPSRRLNLNSTLKVSLSDILNYHKIAQTIRFGCFLIIIIFSYRLLSLIHLHPFSLLFFPPPSNSLRRMYIHTHIHTYIHTYTHTYTPTHTHTHTHTHTGKYDI